MMSKSTTKRSSILNLSAKVKTLSYFQTPCQIGRAYTVYIKTLITGN